MQIIIKFDSRSYDMEVIFVGSLHYFPNIKRVII